jgi:hypothetical protein
MGTSLCEIRENVDKFFMHLIISSGPQIWGSPPNWGLGWVLTTVLQNVIQVLEIV